MNVLRHYGHPVSWSKEVADKPVPVRLLDPPLVIWRRVKTCQHFMISAFTAARLYHSAG